MASQSRHSLRPGDTGKAQAWHLPTFTKGIGPVRRGSSGSPNAAVISVVARLVSRPGATSVTGADFVAVSSSVLPLGGAICFSKLVSAGLAAGLTTSDTGLTTAVTADPGFPPNSFSARR